MTDPRRALPSVDRLLHEPAVASLLAANPRELVVAAAREAIDAVRRGGAEPANWGAEVDARVRRRSAPGMRPVLNATGVVLHTNLGRAPLADAAVAAVAAAAAGYAALEFDIESGARGSRGAQCTELLREITGAEDALVVNNAAGALVLALNTIAAGREVLLSRGELIEIGGAFRIPDILERSGARLREVGTTNRTHLDDYRRGLDAQTGAVLTVHRSNFELRGFVSSPAPSELAGLAAEAGLPYLYDVGSGLLMDLAPWGLSSEPRVGSAVQWGHLVVFSGDKLLGGPQAGCLAGRRDVIERCRANPLARALRADKLTLAALEATLALYRDPETARREIPVLRMLTLNPAELDARARRLAELCPESARATLLPGASAVGGGAFPGAVLPTTLVALAPDGTDADSLAARLRTGQPPVIARVAEGRVLLDVRTLPEPVLADVAATVAGALQG